ncbi:MAG: UDP-N-acetylmuramoyl-L-alanyl-D-glutamate--2,6-diaminopimelate ligase [Desulfurobacteriaceae bacterium]
MKLHSLLQLSGIKWNGKRNPAIFDITDNSKEVKKGSLFCAITGFSFDGNDFVEEAARKGAVAILSDNKKKSEVLSRKLSIPVIYVKNLREKLGIIASHFLGNPSKKIKVIGITGTNGKTTTAYILYEVLNKLGVKTAIIGTVEYGTPENRKPSTRTTPSPIQFQKLLKKFLEEGAEFVVSEVSSHGLALHRVAGVFFTGSIFTNLTQDHLDFHKDLYEYFLAKEKLFFITKEFGIVNIDDSFGKVLAGLRHIFPCKIISFGKDGKVRIKSIVSKHSFQEIYIETKGQTYRVKTNLIGEFNAYNVAAAFSCLINVGFEGKEIENLFHGIKVPGRMEEVENGVFVDYAHTPDALLKVLKTLFTLKKGRIITVFGCGGDRDREKRSLMGEVAEKFSDKVIITNDNPRSEDPREIVEDILKGIKDRSKVEVVLDRKEAIFRALQEKKEKDIVLIAGKGHENYQIIKDTKFYFSDKEVVKEFYGCKGTSKDC